MPQRRDAVAPSLDLLSPLGCDPAAAPLLCETASFSATIAGRVPPLGPLKSKFLAV
jgi:hypothetical protein